MGEKNQLGLTFHLKETIRENPTCLELQIYLSHLNSRQKITHYHETILLQPSLELPLRSRAWQAISNWLKTFCLKRKMTRGSLHLSVPMTEVGHFLLKNLCPSDALNTAFAFQFVLAHLKQYLESDLNQTFVDFQIIDETSVEILYCAEQNIADALSCSTPKIPLRSLEPSFQILKRLLIREKITPTLKNVFGFFWIDQSFNEKHCRLVLAMSREILWEKALSFGQSTKSFQNLEFGEKKPQTDQTEITLPLNPHSCEEAPLSENKENTGLIHQLAEHFETLLSELKGHFKSLPSTPTPREFYLWIDPSWKNPLAKRLEAFLFEQDWPIQVTWLLPERFNLSSYEQFLPYGLVLR